MTIGKTVAQRVANGLWLSCGGMKAWFHTDRVWLQMHEAMIIMVEEAETPL